MIYKMYLYKNYNNANSLMFRLNTNNITYYIRQISLVGDGNLIDIIQENTNKVIASINSNVDYASDYVLSAGTGVYRFELKNIDDVSRLHMFIVFPFTLY